MKDFSKLFSAMSEPRSDALNEQPQALCSQASPGKSEVSAQVFIEIASATWKLRQKTIDPVTQRVKPEYQTLTRYIDIIWDALLSVGIQIQDHTNDFFDSGQSLEVLAFQPTANIAREIVAETVKPTVYYKGQRIQMGQVIVATPEQAQAKSDGV